MRYNLQSRDLRLFCSVCVSSRLKVIGVGVVHLTLLKGLVVSVSIYLDHRSKLMFFFIFVVVVKKRKISFFFCFGSFVCWLFWNFFECQEKTDRFKSVVCF